jgi:hypothetical protein
MQNGWRISTFVSLGALVAVVVAHTASEAVAGSQSHLTSALDKLKDARREAEKAGTGSHTVKALGKIDDAIAETKGAIDAKEEDGGGSPGGGSPEKLIDGRWGVSDGKVHDTQSGLIWQQVHGSEEMKLDDARSHCKSLKLDGGGWRLPSKDELLSIVVKGSHPTIDGAAFPNTPSSDFWTSTSDKTGSFQVTVDFFTGSDSVAPPAITHWARCVRSK